MEPPFAAPRAEVFAPPRADERAVAFEADDRDAAFAPLDREPDFAADRDLEEDLEPDDFLAPDFAEDFLADDFFAPDALELDFEPEDFEPEDLDPEDLEPEDLVPEDLVPEDFADDREPDDLAAVFFAAVFLAPVLAPDFALDLVLDFAADFLAPAFAPDDFDADFAVDFAADLAPPFADDAAFFAPPVFAPPLPALFAELDLVDELPDDLAAVRDGEPVLFFATDFAGVFLPLAEPLFALLFLADDEAEPLLPAPPILISLVLDLSSVGIAASFKDLHVQPSRLHKATSLYQASSEYRKVSEVERVRFLWILLLIMRWWIASTPQNGVRKRSGFTCKTMTTHDVSVLFPTSADSRFFQAQQGIAAHPPELPKGKRRSRGSRTPHRHCPARAAAADEKTPSEKTALPKCGSVGSRRSSGDLETLNHREYRSPVLREAPQMRPTRLKIGVICVREKLTHRRFRSGYGQIDRRPVRETGEDSTRRIAYGGRDDVVCFRKPGSANRDTQARAARIGFRPVVRVQCRSAG